jgi:plasmid stabilization system protein ParE
VARLRYLSGARSDLEQIYLYIRNKSGSGTVALHFVQRLRAKCTELANAPIQMGRPRPELRSGLRSHPYENYVIFFRYLGETLEIVNILEGHRDLDSFFHGRDK